MEISEVDRIRLFSSGKELEDSRSVQGLISFEFLSFHF